jgi:PAS domain-containing protein
LTDRKRTEEALRASEAKYRVIFEHSPLGILHSDKDGIIAAFNQNLIKDSARRRKTSEVLTSPSLRKMKS